MNIEDLQETCNDCKGKRPEIYSCYNCRNGKVLTPAGREFIGFLATWLYAARDGDMYVREDNARDDS